MWFLRDDDRVYEVDVVTWAKSIGEQRSVKVTHTPDGMVSTCFFGQNLGTDEKPIYFETAKFTSTDVVTFKFETMREALRKHDELV